MLNSLTIRSVSDVWVRLGIVLAVLALTVAATMVFAFLHAFDPDPQPRFALIDQDGRAFTEAHLRGQWSLVYFGFTSCPKVCPTQMSKLTQLTNELESHDFDSRLQPVFITVDPDNDDVQAIGDYLEHFHPRFVGLTGEPAALDAAARSFGALTRAGGSDTPTFHSNTIYLMDPSGRLVDYLPFEATVPELRRRVAETMP